MTSRTSQQIQAFERRYGTATLDLACHGAFPLTLTTELLYCLREQFNLDCDWYGAADVLLSGLCRSVGHDLYEMDGPLRNALLWRLAQRLEQRFPERLEELEAFMVAYIRHRLQVEENRRALVLGDPERMHWTALACLRSEEAIEAIRQDLQRLTAADVNPEERFRLAALVESYGDFLAEQDYRPVLLDWAEKLAEGEPIDGRAAAVATAAAAAARAGFPALKTLEFELAEMVLGEDGPDLPIEQLGKFRFETVTVDRRGRIKKREEKEAFYFVEPLGEAGPFLEMVAVQGGRFMMGSPKDEPGRWDSEGPQHEVVVPSFFMGRYPVTQAQWQAIAQTSKVKHDLELNPSHFKGKDRPVERAYWQDAVEFCARLSRETGREYRLPSEAEWEYACRAGTTTPFHFGEMITPGLANYNVSSAYNKGPKGQYRKETTPVGSFPANGFGLCDMHGNVWEWCADHWHENYEGAPTDGSAWLEKDSKLHVQRGGFWKRRPKSCRSASRYFSHFLAPRHFSFGFRVMCVLPRTP